MKTVKKILIIQLIAATTLLSFNSCDLTTFPWTDVASDAVGAELSDFQAITAGAYTLTLGIGFRQFYQTAAYGADDIALSGNTGNHLRYSYNYEHIPNSDVTNDMYRGAYRTIYTANGVIEDIDDNHTDWRFLELKAECLFIRAERHFQLVQVFALPYQKLATRPDLLGIPLLDKRTNELQARATLKESWDFIVNDLLHAIRLFERCQQLPSLGSGSYTRKNCCYASKEVCEALLARIYLYMDRNNEALEYADKVINTGFWQVATAEEHITYPTRVPEANKETIYAFRHTKEEDRDRNGIGSMYYEVGGSGWGEMYCSTAYLEFVQRFPDDVRNRFIVPQYNAEGNITYRNNVPKYYINKYSNQEGRINLSSPVLLRIEEMYLIKAEVYAKSGRDQEAIDIVNMIRQHRGLSGNALYTVNDLKWNTTVLDVVLDERRLEFFADGHRVRDIFRNNRNLERHYPGFHQRIDDKSGPNNNFDMLVLHTNPRLAHYFPQREMEMPGNKLINND